jgi:hypothetical protein
MDFFALYQIFIASVLPPCGAWGMFMGDNSSRLGQSVHFSEQDFSAADYETRSPWRI